MLLSAGLTAELTLRRLSGAGARMEGKHALLPNALRPSMPSASTGESYEAWNLCLASKRTGSVMRRHAPSKVGLNEKAGVQRRDPPAGRWDLLGPERGQICMVCYALRGSPV